MNYIENCINMNEVMIIRPFNKIDYCCLIKDEYVNIMTGLTENIHSNVLGIVPVDIEVSMLRIVDSYKIGEIKDFDNGQWIRLKKDDRYSFNIFCYDYCNFCLIGGETFWSFDKLLEKYKHIQADTVELLDMNYKITTAWKGKYENCYDSLF